MDGWIRLATTREPHTAAARRALGQDGVFFIVRDATSGEAAGCGEYAVNRVYLDGRAHRLPYFGSLRVLPAWRNRIAPLREAFALARRLQAMRGDLPVILTSIGSGNQRAQRLLTANLPGMPDYHHVGRMVSLAISTSRGRACRSLRSPDRVELPLLSAFLQNRGRQHQFAPVWDMDLLATVLSDGGLSFSDVLISERSGRPEGVIAVWDQRQFKQIVTAGYQPWLARLRPAVNPVLSMLGRPALPRPDTQLSHVYLSHAVLPSRQADAFTLIAGALAIARRKGAQVALLGLAADHPLADPIARRFGAVTYDTDLYLLSWKSDPPPPALDPARVLAPEIAML